MDLGPPGAGNPLRITYNAGTDLRPAWLPDGSGFFYTAERLDRADADRCLARMAARGGTILDQVCDRTPTTDDSVAVFEQAALNADGRLAYVRASTPISPPSVAPRTLELRLGTAADPAGAILLSFPYAGPNNRIHQGLERLQWSGGTALAYIAQEMHYEAPCRGCELDTIAVGIAAVLLDPGTGLMFAVPGTDSVTGLALAGSDTLYYTVASSALIYRRVLSTGVVTTAATFVAPVRDVAAGGGRLVAITGTGSLWLVNPGASPFLLGAPGPRAYRRPALSPDGRHIVVEGYQMFDPLTASRSADLWLFDLP